MVVERTVLHHNWNGDVKNGWNVALLKLPEPVDSKYPRLANRSFTVYPSMTIDILVLHDTLRRAEMDVVPCHLCPGLGSIALDMFCVHSELYALERGTVQ